MVKYHNNIIVIITVIFLILFNIFIIIIKIIRIYYTFFEPNCAALQTTTAKQKMSF